MQMWKAVFGVIGALVPVVYCGYLLYYFYDVSGSVKEAEEIGLGPTLLGLSVVGLLFCIPLMLKIVRLFAGPRSPGPSGLGGSDRCPEDDEGGFDAEAVVARYMARRAAEPSPVSPAAPPPPSRKGGAPDKPRSFGRKK